MRIGKLIPACLLILSLVPGCSNQTAAKVGHRIGIVIGKPLGVIAATGEHAYRTCSKIVVESVRQQQQLNENKLEHEENAAPNSQPSQNIPYLAFSEDKTVIFWD